MRWFPVVLLLSAFVAAAQNTPSSTNPAPGSEQKKIRVEGNILSLNGEAVRKATVRLQGTAIQPGQLPTSYSEATDNDGKFVSKTSRRAATCCQPKSPDSSPRATALAPTPPPARSSI